MIYFLKVHHVLAHSFWRIFAHFKELQTFFGTTVVLRVFFWVLSLFLYWILVQGHHVEDKYNMGHYFFDAPKMLLSEVTQFLVVL